MKREHPSWMYGYPDERNALLEVARTLIGAVLDMAKKSPEARKAMPEWLKSARAFMKETNLEPSARPRRTGRG